MKRILFIVYLISLSILLALLIWPQDNNNDLYIEVLKYGEANMGNPISYNQLKSHLDDIEIEYNDFTAMYLFSSNYFDVNKPLGNSFLILADSTSFYLHIADSESFFLDSKGYANLLSYNELREARGSSRKSMLVAIIAILFAPFSLILLTRKTENTKSNSDYNTGDREPSESDVSEKQSHDKEESQEDIALHKASGKG